MNIVFVLITVLYLTKDYVRNVQETHIQNYKQYKTKYMFNC